MQAASMRQFADRIATILESLPENERLVMALHYQEDLSYREIAQVMNLTAGRISQIHTQGMIRIRAKLKINSSS
jgi:RNA polymerase sigma factor for flagellar operon FliA